MTIWHYGIMRSLISMFPGSMISPTHLMTFLPIDQLLIIAVKSSSPCLMPRCWTMYKENGHGQQRKQGAWIQVISCQPTHLSPGHNITCDISVQAVWGVWGDWEEPFCGHYLQTCVYAASHLRWHWLTAILWFLDQAYHPLSLLLERYLW